MGGPQISRAKSGRGRGWKEGCGEGGSGRVGKRGEGKLPWAWESQCTDAGGS